MEEYTSRILQVEHAISPELCADITAFAMDNRNRLPATVGKGKKNRSIRYADIINTKGILTRLNDTVADLVKRHIEPFFCMEMACFEKPELIAYPKDGKYEPHIDGEVTVRQPDGSYKWERFLARDISIILYVNEGYTGGNLYFPNFDLKIRPRPGLLVAFPSGRPYLHKAETVESGERLVIVSWATSLCMGPLRKDPPAGTVYMKNYRKASG